MALSLEQQEEENLRNRRRLYIDPFPNKDEHLVEIAIMSIFWIIFWGGFFGGIIYSIYLIVKSFS
jgi:hypothetical protein